jgi:heptosyltransferase-2
VSVAAPSRILVRAPSWVGDAVMATPAIRALRRAHPAAELVLEGRAHLLGLLKGLPGVDAFWPEGGRGVRDLAAETGRMRAQGFDWAVLLPDSVRVAVAPFLARIPLRCGYARDLARRVLLTRALDPPRENGRRAPVSMIERFLRITRALGCADRGERLDLPIDPDARDRLEGRLARGGLLEESIVVVTPGASFGASKLWPPDHFAAACDALSERFGLRTVLAPGPGEEQVARAIAERMTSGALTLEAPVTQLEELAALIERARLVVTNDTGPRHIAVALDRPVVSVLGPTDPRHTAHLLERQRVLREPVDCSPCHKKVCPIDHRCMTRLRPERVVEAAAELLS